MAIDRQIVFGTHAVPQETTTLEEGTVGKKSILANDASGNAVNKSFGSSSTCTDLNKDQSNDAWISLTSPKKKWEDWNLDTDHLGDKWEDVYSPWDGTQLVATSPGVQLSPSTDTDTDTAFVYVRNVGDTHDVSLSLTGVSGNYLILVPPGGSVCFRGTDANFNRKDVYAKGVGGTTSIEYIVANK